MNKKWWFLSVLSCMMVYTSCIGSTSLQHVDSQQVQQYKITIKKTAKKYRYIRYALRAGALASVVYALSRLVTEQYIPLAQVKELTKECPCILGHLKDKIPAVTIPQTRGFFSRVSSGVKSFVTSSMYVGTYLVQQLIAFRIFGTLNVKMDTLFKYPGSIDWFVEGQTDLTILLDQYQEKTELLEQSDKHLKSEIKRSKEFIRSQWNYMVSDIEHLLGYMGYKKEELSNQDVQECTTIISYITQCTDETADILTLHLNDLDSSYVCNKIKQFKAELTSLLSRFSRLVS